MLIWGGHSSGQIFNNGALYNPHSDHWSSLNTPNPPPGSFGATVVWTGSRAIVWGGTGNSGPVNSGGALIFTGTPINPTPSSWQATATSGAPSARTGHTAVWTGSKMLIWGGVTNNTPAGDGAAYDPLNDTWNPISTSGAPSARTGHSAVWSGTEMLVFGGENNGGQLASGGAYNPATDRWRPLSQNGGPLARTAASAVWSGTELIIFGGTSSTVPQAGLQRLNPQASWTFYRKP
jgi:N-acetylneuraminic acid mutarotase